MVRRPGELPGALGDGPFSTRDARAAGVSGKRLQTGDLFHPFHAVHAREAATDLASRCAAFMVRMPEPGFFCGPTAALLWGIPLPRRLEQEPVLHVGLPADHRAVRVKGVRGHHLGVRPGEVRYLDDVPVSSPARTWLDLAPLVGLTDLVAAGDYLLHGEVPRATYSELERTVRRAVRMRGVRRLREALPLLDGRAESRAETRLRLVLGEEHLDGFEPNHWVSLDRPRVRYRIDIAFPRDRLGIEYQGEYHHDPGQWRKDMTRLSRLRAAGWTMVEVSARDLDDPRELTHRIRALLSQLRRHRSPL